MRGLHRHDLSETMSPKYVVITPVRNEAKYVGRTIESMAAQSPLPTHWVIVDDGSTDGTSDILAAAARRYAWVTVVNRPDRGFRKTGGGVVEAFYDGYATLREDDWDLLVKLDGDLSFAADYFQKCLDHFARDPRLGIAGGTIYVIEKERLKVDSPGDPEFHVRGATKIYRNACWRQIHPLIPAPGWDTIDELKANMLGWKTRTLGDVPLVQHRATGAVNGEWPNWFKNGLANYITGYHPAFMFAKCVKRLGTRPPVVAAAALWMGFCSGFFKRQPHVAESSVVRYLRRQQIRFLMGRSSIYQSPHASLGRPADTER
jgi:biofilm PGA synthesis N-glycosyltransferase PgaC